MQRLGVTWFLLGLVLVWVAGESRTSYFTQGCDGWWAWYPALMIAAAGSWLVSGILDAVAAYRAPRRGAQVSLAVLAVLALGLAMLFVTGMVGVLIAVADFSAGC